VILQLLGALSALPRHPALRRAIMAVLVALALWGVGAAIMVRVRVDAALEVRRELDAQQSQEVKDAIKRAAPGPRPSSSEFVACL